MHLTNAKFLYSGESLALIPTFLWLGNALSRSIRLYSNHNTRFYLVLLCITLSRIGNTLMNFIFNSPLDPTQFKVVFITLCLFEFPCSAGMTSLLVWCLYRVCGKGLGNKINLVFLLLAVSQLWNFAAYGILIVQIAAGWSTALGDHMIISWSAFDAVLDMGLSWLLICGLRKQTTKVGTFVSHNRLQMLLIQVELLLPVECVLGFAPLLTIALFPHIDPYWSVYYAIAAARLYLLTRFLGTLSAIMRRRPKGKPSLTPHFASKFKSTTIGIMPAFSNSLAQSSVAK
ncbi:hypothetical protein BC828DRAFT_371905 [Blastocladiella britannica]|nr:hypothetical protein BC828DRAFT_371905 [Blastocladiella britannica]